MPISIERLPDEPIVMVRITSPLDIRKDVPYLSQELGRVFDTSPEYLFDITDTVGLKVSFSDLVNGMAMLTKGEHNVLRHPKAIGYAIVVDNVLIQMGGKALRQAQYGNIGATVVETLDEAFVVAREAIAKHKAAHS